jgi:hypothetical protein
MMILIHLKMNREEFVFWDEMWNTSGNTSNINTEIKEDQ